MKQSFVLIMPHLRNGTQPGGIRTSHMIEAFTEMNADVTVLVPSIDTWTGEGATVFQNDTHVNIKYFKTVSFERNMFVKRILSQLIYALVLFTHLLSNYFKYKGSIFILNTNPYVVHILIGMMLKASRFKYILDVRDVFHYRYDKGTFKFKLFRSIDKFIASSSNGAIFVTNRMRTAYGYDESKSAVVPLCFDNNNNNNVLKRSFIPSEAKIVYIGSLNDTYSISCLENLLERGSFIGSVSYIGNDHDKISSARVEKKRAVKKNELNNILKSYDVGFIGTQNTRAAAIVLGNKVFDYLAAGLPIIHEIGGVGEISEFTTQYSCGLSFTEIDWSSSEKVYLEIDFNLLQKFNPDRIKTELKCYFDACNC